MNENYPTTNQIWYSETACYKYRTERDLILFSSVRPPVAIMTDEFSIETDGTLRIFKGYLFDGASGPAIDRKENMRGACGHDALSEAARQGLLTQADKKLANADLVKWCIEDGMSKWWANNIYGLGVSLTNNWWRKTNKPDHIILIAP